MKLYALYLVKGKQLYKIGDNIKNHLDCKEDFNEKKLLDWGTDFSQEIHDADLINDMKDGYYDFWGYNPPKKEKELINHSIVIVNGKGTIKGILEINKNNREELKGVIMNGEKVKEIKDCLDCCKDRDCETCLRLNCSPRQEEDCRLVLINNALDLINELESENKDYYDRLNNLQTYIDNHEEIWKGNTKIQLKQFAERLKERLFDLGNIVNENDIDETLKEFIGEQ